MAYFKAGDHTQIELFRTKDFPEKVPGDAYVGLRHLAFDVDDVDVWAERLKEKKIKITVGPLDLAALRKRVILFEAPDNVIIELMMSMD